MIVGKVEGDCTAPVMAGEPNFIVAESFYELINVRSQSAFVVASHRTLGVAQTAQVGSNDCETLSQGRNDLPPLVPTLRPPVQENQWIARTSDDIVHAKAVDGCDMMGPGVRHEKYLLVQHSAISQNKVKQGTVHKDKTMSTSDLLSVLIWLTADCFLW